MIREVPGNLYLLQLAHHSVLRNSPALFTLLYKGGGISEKKCIPTEYICFEQNLNLLNLPIEK